LAGASASMNCGRSARKKIATFGLSTLVASPWAKSRAKPGLAARSPSTASDAPGRTPSRSMPNASQRRYAAPAHLTSANAAADAASSAARPNAATSA